MTTGHDDLRAVLRQLKVFDTELPHFDVDEVPPVPDRLFSDWLTAAIDAGVREPHAMTLSTVDRGGRPNARVLILRRLNEGRWGFATSRSSPKADELVARRWAALSFYWREVGRQVRVRGEVIDAGREEAAQDFLARPDGSRAEAWVGNQSRVLGSTEELDRALSVAHAQIAARPDAVPDHWTRYDLIADEVEFWQADRDRRHTRLRYRLTDGAWTRELLWP